MLAFATWMRRRGGAAGYMFCDLRQIGGRWRLFQTEPINPRNLVALLRKLYAPCGVLDANELATHTAKRSGVQFYEAIQQTPVWIMDKGGWTDPASFMRYRGLCNRLAQRQAYSTKASW